MSVSGLGFFPLIACHLNVINCDNFQNYAESVFAEDFLTQAGKERMALGALFPLSNKQWESPVLRLTCSG